MANSKRRGRGEGSFYQRDDGLWVGVLSLGRDARGKRLRKFVYGATKDEVRAKAKTEQDRAPALNALEPTKETVAEYMYRWLGIVEGQLSANTLDCYRTQIDLRIVPLLGTVLVHKLTAEHVRTWLSALRADGASPRVVQLSRAVLRCALNSAGHWDRMAVSAETKNMLKAPKAARKKPVVWDEEQSRRFIDAIRGHVFEGLFYLAVTTGMRIGEMLGLPWAHVDWNNSTINVSQKLLQVRGKIIGIGPTKTRAGERAIAVTKPVLAILKAHRARQQQARLRAGLPVSQYVFVTQPSARRQRKQLQNDPGWLLRQSVERSLDRVIQRCGLPRVTVHQLRHTHITLLLKAGVHPKVAQERAGHSNISVTMDMYSHVMPGMQAEAAGKLDAILAGPVPDATKAAGDNQPD